MIESLLSGIMRSYFLLLPWNQPLLQEALVPFCGKWYVETTVWVLMELIVTHLIIVSRFFSMHRVRFNLKKNISWVHTDILIQIQDCSFYYYISSICISFYQQNFSKTLTVSFLQSFIFVLRVYPTGEIIVKLLYYKSLGIVFCVVMLLIEYTFRFTYFIWFSMKLVIATKKVYSK